MAFKSWHSIASCTNRNKGSYRECLYRMTNGYKEKKNSGGIWLAERELSNTSREERRTMCVHRTWSWNNIRLVASSQWGSGSEVVPGERVDHSFLVFAASMSPSSIILDDAFDTAAYFRVQSRIYKSLFASIAG
jgi:hypothetical protein